MPLLYKETDDQEPAWPHPKEQLPRESRIALLSITKYAHFESDWCYFTNTCSFTKVPSARLILFFLAVGLLLLQTL